MAAVLFGASALITTRTAYLHLDMGNRWLGITYVGLALAYAGLAIFSGYQQGARES